MTNKFTSAERLIRQEASAAQANSIQFVQRRYCLSLAKNRYHRPGKRCHPLALIIQGERSTADKDVDVAKKLKVPVMWVKGVEDGYNQGAKYYPKDADYMAGHAFGQKLLEEFPANG